MAPMPNLGVILDFDRPFLTKVDFSIVHFEFLCMPKTELFVVFKGIAS